MWEGCQGRVRKGTRAGQSGKGRLGPATEQESEGAGGKEEEMKRRLMGRSRQRRAVQPSALLTPPPHGQPECPCSLAIVARLHLFHHLIYVFRHSQGHGLATSQPRHSRPYGERAFWQVPPGAQWGSLSSFQPFQGVQNSWGLLPFPPQVKNWNPDASILRSPHSFRSSSSPASARSIC